MIKSDPPLTLDERVDKILSETPLFDGHDDLAWEIREKYRNQIYQKDFTEPFTRGHLPGHVDLPRLAKGRVGGTFWSVYVKCPENWMDFSNDNYALRVRQTMEQVDLISRLQQAYPDIFSSPPNSSTALQAWEDKKIISPLGIEGLHSIGNSLAQLRQFHRLGVSYAILTHDCHNIYADSAQSEFPGGILQKAHPFWNGVSEAGKRLVREMNRLGMIVDLAHVSADTMRDVLGGGKDDWRGSQAPVIFSHSAAFELCPHPRNVPDDVLKLVKERDSLVMVNFYSYFISCTAAPHPDEMPIYDPDHATLEHVADHIMHIADVTGGFDHVGLGSDFDGVDVLCSGLEDASKFPELIKELLRRNVSDEDAKKVIGGNLLRVWKKVDEIALKMQETEEPAEDILVDDLPNV
ncbi:hypothetical protein HFD88_004946 [Aspergillus terreus]|nr:hypothetical protein HFD88_004946 [Aspergillus terreus]